MIDWSLVQREDDRMVLSEPQQPALDLSAEVVPDFSQVAETRLLSDSSRSSTDFDHPRAEELRSLGSPSACELVRSVSEVGLVEAEVCSDKT